MSKCYTASPFWTRYEKTVKAFMLEATKGLGYEINDPEKFGLLVTDGDRYKHACAIFKSNVDELKSSDCLVFPRYTTDLGTLFEVGYALGLGKPILRYEFLADKCTELRPLKRELPPQWVNHERVTIHIESQTDAVLFGLAAAKLPNAKEQLCYSLKGNKDNLMLSANFSYMSEQGLIKPEDRNWEEMR